MTTKSKMREAMICVIVLIAAFVWAIKELSKGIDQKTFLKKNPKILQILLKIGQNFQDALKTLKLKYVNINSLSEKDILITDTFRKDHEFCIRVADIDIESISKDCGCEDCDLNKKAESIVSEICKDIRKMFDLLDDYKNGDLMDVWFDDYTVTLVIKLKSLKSVKDSEEKSEALKMMPVKENVFMDYDMIYEVFSDYLTGEAINESEQDNYVLMESCIDEQVLQEMHFSKKDLQDPATIDKILKAKGVFENILKYTAFLFSALNFVAGIVVKVKLDKKDITPSGGIGAGTVLLLEAILIKIYSIAKDIPAKQYAKNIDKYKKQVQDLITKMEEKKKSDPDNADKYQKVIDNCKSVLAEFDRRDKEAQKIQKEQYLQAVEGFYSDLKLWWHNPGCFGHTGGYDDYLTKYQSLKLAELYGIKEQVVIDNFASKLKNKQYIIDPDRYSLIFGEDDADDVQKAFKDSRLFLFKSDDDYSKFVVEKTKKMYETYVGITYKSCGIYADVEDEVNRDALKEFDRIHGFYKFSKCPDAVKQKDFLEELNKKYSVKENADMVIDINPINEGLFKKKDMSPLEIIEDMYKKFKAWWNKPHTLESLPGQKHSGITAGADLADALTYDSFQIAEAYGITESQIATRFIERAPKYTTIINQENYKKMYTDQGFNVPKMEAILKSEDLYNIAWDGNDFMKYVSSKTKKVYEAHESEGNENSFKPSKIYTGFYFKINKEALKEFDAKYGFYKFSKCPEGETKKNFIDSLEGKSSVKESVEETITEGFGIDKSQKASLSDLELSYDRKFNAFCLSVSSYSPEKLRNTLIQKQNALTDAQKEKKEAKDRYAKLAAQLNIDYLKNTIEKTNTLIKRKSKAEAQSTAAIPRKKVNESVEVLNELFGKKWKADKEAKSEPPKPTEPKRKYANLTKEEFEKCMSIIKTNVGKYPRLKKVINYDHNGCYSTYQKYIDFDEDEVVVAFLEWGEYDNEIKDEDKLDKFLNELDKDQSKCYASISKEFSQLSFKVEFETVPDAEFDCLCINSRKPLESTNEAVKLSSKFKEDIDGTNYSFRTREVNITSELKEKVISRAKQYIAKENSIKKQVYAFKNNSSKEEFEKDRIEGFEIINPIHDEYKKDEFELGIFFSSVNQYYTMVNKHGKIYEKDTMTT